MFYGSYLYVYTLVLPNSPPALPTQLSPSFALQPTQPQVFYGSYLYVYTLVLPNSMFIFWGWPEQAAQ